MEAKMITLDNHPELTPAEAHAIADIARRAALAGGLAFLTPQAG
jgi:hypothetical protein